MKTRFSVIGAVVLSFAGVAGVSGADADFTVSFETGTDPGAYYTGYHAADGGTDTVLAIGFQIDITQVNGSPVSFTEPFAAFCVELEEAIDTLSYNYDFVNLSAVSRGRAGEAGTASSAMPVGGIGALAASRVQALFDGHYTSTRLTDWTFTEAAPETHAFQLALWEITHDSDLSLSMTGGAVYVGAQSVTLQTNAIALAQTWLDGLTGVTTGYVPTVWDVWALEDIGNPGNQDIVFAMPIGSSVPEPASGFFVLMGVAALGMRRRRG